MNNISFTANRNRVKSEKRRRVNFSFFMSVQDKHKLEEYSGDTRSIGKIPGVGKHSSDFIVQNLV